MKQLLIVVDTETTGIPRNGLKSAERAIVVAAEAVEVELSPSALAEGKFFTVLGPPLELMIRPVVWSPQSEKALSVNGLKKEEVEEKGLSASAAWAKVEKWLEELAGKTSASAEEVYWLAYNSSFDQTILTILMNDAGLDLKEAIRWPDWKCGKIKALNGWLLGAARQGLPRLSRYRLADVWGHLGLTQSRGAAHNALNDVRMTIDIARQLILNEI